MFKRLLLAVGVLAAPVPAQAEPIPPAVAITQVEVAEGNVGLQEFEATVALVAAPQGMSYSVDVTAVPLSATEDDYVFTRWGLVLTPDSSSQVVRGFVVGDTVLEGDESFILRASLYAPGTGAFLGSSDGMVVIVDDDVTPRLYLYAGTAVPEGNDGWHVVYLPANLSAPAKQAVTFDYELRGGRPGDYRPTRGTMTFPPGETFVSIPIEIYGDTLSEPDLTIEVAVTSVSGALLTSGVGNVIVTNDDLMQTIFAMDVTVDEGNAGTTPASVLFTFSPPVPNDATLTLTLVGGLAVAGADFVFDGPKTVNLPAGTAELSFPVEVRGDTTPECDEGLTVRFRASNLGDDGVHEVRLTIRNDDAPHPPSCSDPFIALPMQHPGRQVDGAVEAPDAGAPRADGGAPVDPPGTPIDGGGLARRRGCACSTATDAPSFGAMLVLGAAWLATRRRSRSSARVRES